MISSPRSNCPINRGLEVLGDRWSLVILRDISLHGRRSFRDLLTSNGEGISAPVLSRRLSDLTEAGLLIHTDAPRGKQGRYSLTELGLRTVPVMVELARFGAAFDPETAIHLPDFLHKDDEFSSRFEALRQEHLAETSSSK